MKKLFFTWNCFSLLTFSIFFIFYYFYNDKKKDETIELIFNFHKNDENYNTTKERTKMSRLLKDELNKNYENKILSSTLLTIFSKISLEHLKKRTNLFLINFKTILHCKYHLVALQPTYLNVLKIYVLWVLYMNEHQLKKVFVKSQKQLSS